ncbi:MAG: hypothetical protein MOGMAGMI_01839 [Candidatus Omnitrophica bacterium]|nr:hypothetical protein [Ignavibacteriaceae bacterium]MCG3176875.1 hypothetical protein [Candidatus Omnitrophota bacterium]
MLIFHLANVIRSFLWMWLGIELIILWFVYNFGYKNYRKTPIIEALQAMILSLALQYGVISFLPLTLSLNPKIYPFLVNFTIPIAFISVMAVRKFRHLSLWEDKLNLPESKSIKKIILKGGVEDEKGNKDN